jgi:hypothetical protein
MRAGRKTIAVVVIAACAALAYGVRRWQSSATADGIAASETRMWQAYYRHDPQTVGLELVALLRGQFGLSFPHAVDVAQPLGSAAMTFSRSSEGYETRVLPDLERAYGTLKMFTGRSFDPDEAARAELSWWVARRTPGRESPEEVGERIAALYAVLYGSMRPGFVHPVSCFPVRLVWGVVPLAGGRAPGPCR